MIYKLEKPDISKVDSERITKLITDPSDELVQDVWRTMEPEYQYWDQVKYKPRPENLNAPEFWAIVKSIRATPLLGKTETVIRDENGTPFSWMRLSKYDKFFHRVDLEMGGNLLVSPSDADEKLKYRFLSRGIIEEAIASSQLEGANTSREAAKKFLREGREPRDKGEQMILNNYQVMKRIEESLKDEKMSLSLLLELHAELVRGTDIPENKIGKFRDDEDNIVVQNEKGVTYHKPPSRKFVDEEVVRVIAFMNEEITTGFIHPVVKAVMIHFWLGYLHPFIDGNGRLARALFYWYLIRQKYRAFAYVPISKTIKNAPMQYAMAYVYSEQDDNDLTYFIDYNIRKIELAIRDFEEYRDAQSKKNSGMRRAAREKYGLNDRQIQLLQYFYKKKDDSTSLKTHMNIYQVAWLTAARDLNGLKKLGFVTKRKISREFHYFATEKVAELFD